MLRNVIRLQGYKELIIVANKIQDMIPDSIILINEIPKQWVDYEIYCRLIPNEEE